MNVQAREPPILPMQLEQGLLESEYACDLQSVVQNFEIQCQERPARIFDSIDRNGEETQAMLRWLEYCESSR